MKNYLFILDFNFRGAGLISDQFLALFKLLRTQGSSVTVFVPVEPAGVIAETFSHHGIETFVFKKWRKIPEETGSKRRWLAASKEIIRLQKQYHINRMIFHFCDPKLVIGVGLGFLLHRMEPTPKMFFHQHNEVLGMDKKLQKVPFLKRFVSKLGIASFFLDKVICVYEKGGQNLVQKGLPKEKIGFIYNGISLENKLEPDREAIRAKLNVRTNDTIGLFAGRLIKGKGVEILIEALSKIEKKGLNMHLLVAGQGEESRKLQGRAKQLGVDQRVTFLGYRRDLSDLMAAADFLVLPSHTEALPSVILEAGLQGCPAVASSVGGIPEMVQDGETGLIVTSFDVEDWTIALCRLIQKPELLSWLRQKCGPFISNKFSLAKVVRHMAFIYSTESA